MIIFKILLIILVVLPVLFIAGIWFVQIWNYVSKMNERDARRNRDSSGASERSIR